MPRVRLTETERQELEDVLTKGRHTAATATRARILLKADESEAGPGWPDGEIVRALDTSRSTVRRVRPVFVESGLDAALGFARLAYNLMSLFRQAVLRSQAQQPSRPSMAWCWPSAAPGTPTRSNSTSSSPYPAANAPGSPASGPTAVPPVIPGLAGG